MADKSKFTPFAIITKPLRQARDLLMLPVEGKEMARRASQAAYDKYGENEEWMGKGDAFRHMAWQAMMAEKYGKPIAAMAGWAHELGMGGPFGKNPDQTDMEREMDLYNNSLGRDIGSKSKSYNEMFDMIVNSIDQGKARYLDPHDMEYYSKLEKLQKGIIPE